MMNFYEEFGVSNDASVEEIRLAYKILARVLHPDSQTDEKLRVAAACQMKRLHDVLDILVDPAKRRAYDESLEADIYPDPASHGGRRAAVARFFSSLGKGELAQAALRYWSWILIGCMILGSGFWYMTGRAPAPVESALNAFSTPAPPNETGPALQPVKRPARRITADKPADSTARPVLPSFAGALPQKSAANSAPPELPDIPAPMPAAIPAPAQIAAYSPKPVIPKPEPAPAVSSARRPSLAGNWFYAPAVEKPGPNLYPPVDIELRLTEKDGILNGQYRGKYKVPDKAVSQDVLFQVQGKATAGAPAVLVWTSGDGASGTIDLDLRQPDLMKVTWWTTQPGRRPGLSSGAATLLRQQTP